MWMRMRMLFVLVLVYIFLVSSAQSQGTKKDLAFFKLALHWPYSYCTGAKYKSVCKTPVQQHFKIYGFWPFLADDNIYANRSEIKFPHNDQIGRWNFISSLNSLWPNLDVGGDNVKLWNREWIRYGPYGMRASEYFHLALHYAEKYVYLLDMVIRSGEVRPREEPYTREVLRDKIAEKLETSPELGCNKNKDGVIQLLGIHICIDHRREKAIDCPYSNSFLLCGKLKEQVMFPTKDQKSYYD